MPLKSTPDQAADKAAGPHADPKVVRAWCMYDWANSAYILTVATAVLPAWFAAGIVGPEGYDIFGTNVSATTLWGLTVGLSALAVFMFAPVLGAAADLTGRAGSFLRLFCLLGAASAFGLGFQGPGDVVAAVLLFALAQASFNSANVFYDAFLPRIVPDSQTDTVSGRGYAYGYIGGGLHFLLCLVLMAMHERLGLTQGQAAQISIATAALWWAGFSVPTFMALRDAPTGNGKGIGHIVRHGVDEAVATARTLVRGGPAATFLLAYLLYNDGIQTTISMATIYGAEELGLATTELMITLLVIQAVAFAGSLLFARLAGRIGTKAAIMVALAVWTGVAGCAYVIETAVQFFVLGGFVGLVLGGSQALSRSLYAKLVPREASARYFGYFSVVTKFSAVGGPLIFALMRHWTGSSRPAVLIIAIFFLLGMVVLSRVRVPPERDA